MIGSIRNRWHIFTMFSLIVWSLSFGSCASSMPQTSGTTTTTTRSSTPPVAITIPPAPAPTTATPTPQVIAPLQLSTDLYSQSQGQYQTEVEPGAYAFGSTIVTALQAGRFSDDGSANIGWATTNDGGMTWKSGFLPGTTRLAGGSYDRITDPTVTFDALHNTWMIGSVAFVYTSGGIAAPVVLVNLSTDGGLTWSRPIAVDNVGFHGYLDKDWVDCDNTASSPYYGHCYAVWDDYDRSNLMEMSTSTDGGRSWGSVLTTTDGVSGLDAGMLIQPDGRVIVPILSKSQTAISVYTSTNGGVRWNRSITITSAYSYASTAYYQDHILLSAAMDGSGKLYFVWIDCRFEAHCRGNDLVMTTSLDGVTWQAVQRIPLAAVGSGINYYINGLGADAATASNQAHLGLAFYSYSPSCGSDCPLYVSFSSSTDGGKSWSANKQLAGPMYASWLPRGNNKVGDYISTVFANGRAFPIFEIAQALSGGHLNEATYTIAGGLPV